MNSHEKLTRQDRTRRERERRISEQKTLKPSPEAKASKAKPKRSRGPPPKKASQERPRKPIEKELAKAPKKPISKLNLTRRRTLWYVLIRHACDEPDHTSIKYKHDPPLCKNIKHNKEDIIDLVHALCDQCGGEPEMIFTGPLLRCVDTAKRMMKVLTGKPELIIDPNVSRYFSHSEQEKPKISKKSIERETPITESKREFEKRIEKHLNRVEKSKVRVIWCITHALVMKRVDKLNQEKNPFDHIEPLEYKVFERGVKR
jgi:broad specificity phosphatase PhoE